ncbi:MAG: DUF2490 domain-containing protein [Bacteroidetes bacterium]|nr:MAG: DUF2490 domain-containing protein [Bacteroidota bacterium]
MKKLTCAIFMLTFALQATFAQQADLGSWNIIHVNQHVNDKWAVFGEAQLRSLKFYNHFHYYEYKGGIQYKIYPNFKFTLGAGSYQTYKEGGDFVLPKNNNEFRLWPQFVLSQQIGKVKVEQRYRAELRFTSNGYRNRFRYRLGLSLPFGKEKAGYKPFQLSASNELFFTDNEPYFERNRALMSFNYKPSKMVTLQLGYLHQFDYKINDETGRDFLQIGLFFELFAKRTKNTESDTDLKDN